MHSPEIKTQNLLTNQIFWISLLCFVTLILWFPTRNLPYWWDSAGYVIHGARYYINTNFSSIFLPSDSAITAFAHPPFFVFTLALLWRVFGESLLISHIYYLMFVLLAVIFTYLLGKTLVNFREEAASHLVGVGAALFLLFSPVFLAQVGIVYPEIPITAFGVMTVYFFLKKKIPWYLVSAFLMVFTKETSAIVIFAILGITLIQFISGFLKKKERNFKKIIKTLFIYSLPLILLASWFVAHKIVTGWMFVMPYYQENLTKEALSLLKIKLPLRFFFTEQSRAILSLFILGTFLFSVLKKEKRNFIVRLEILLFVLVLIFLILLFGIVDFLHRYIIFGLPFFYVLFFYCLAVLIEEKSDKDQFIIFFGITLVFLTLFYFSWDNHRSFNNSLHATPLEENLEYRDIISMGQNMARFIEKYYPNAVVWTAFPTNYMLSEPFQHYVSKPIETHDCNTYKEGDRVDLVVLHLFSPPQVECFGILNTQDMQNNKFLLLIPFQENGKWIQIYKNPNLKTL